MLATLPLRKDERLSGWRDRRAFLLFLGRWNRILSAFFRISMAAAEDSAIVDSPSSSSSSSPLSVGFQMMNPPLLSTGFFVSSATRAGSFFVSASTSFAGCACSRDIHRGWLPLPSFASRWASVFEKAEKSKGALRRQRNFLAT